MEENTSFCEPARSETPVVAAAATTASASVGSYTTSSHRNGAVPVVAAAPNHCTTSPKPSANDSDPAQSPPTAASVASQSSTWSIHQSFESLNLSEAQAVARELGVDISDLLTDVNGLIVERLAAARQKSRGSDRTTSNSSSTTSSTNSCTVNPTEYREYVSPEQQRHNKRRRGADSGGDYAWRNDDDATKENSALRVFLMERNVSDLKAIAREKSVSLEGLLEKSEMIDRLIASWPVASPSGVASLPNSSSPAFLDDGTMDSWSISDIRALAGKVNVALSPASNDRDAMLDVLRSAATQSPHVARYLQALAPLTTLTIAELQKVACDSNVSLHGCIEKGDILHALVTKKN